jgi:hypothetical protein
MEQFLVRISLKHTKGAQIANFYNRESFNMLNIERHTYDNSQFIDIGDIIVFSGERYMVKDINFKLDEHIHFVDNLYGVNLYSPTDSSDFNCQIGIFVENE